MEGKCFCYLNGIEVKDSKARPFTNVLEMTLNKNMVEGNVVRTTGYYNAGDGGNATYFIRKKLESDTILTPGIQFVQNDLVAEIILGDSEVANVRQFGAKGDGLTNDRESIMNLLMSNDFDTIMIANGTYVIDDSLIIPSYKTLILNNATIVSNNKVNPIFEIVSNNVNIISYNSKIMFSSTGNEQTAIEISSSKFVRINGLELNRYTTGVKITDSKAILIRDCIFRQEDSLIYEIQDVYFDELSENILNEDNFTVTGTSHNPIPTPSEGEELPGVDDPEVDVDDPTIVDPENGGTSGEPDHNEQVTPDTGDEPEVDVDDPDIVNP